jgi:hypothetical protein
MSPISKVIVRFVEIAGIVDHHCLETIVHFVDIGGIVNHHCLETTVVFVDICGVMINNSTNINKANNHL